MDTTPKAATDPKYSRSLARPVPEAAPCVTLCVLLHDIGFQPYAEGDAPIEIVQYDPLWPSKFEAERVLLQAVLARWLMGPIEHVGSTAIPGMSAKPIIDIMARSEERRV